MTGLRRDKCESLSFSYPDSLRLTLQILAINKINFDVLIFKYKIEQQLASW